MIPNFQDFMNPVLSVFAKLNNEAKVKDIEESVAKALNLTSEEKIETFLKVDKQYFIIVLIGPLFIWKWQD